MSESFHHKSHGKQVNKPHKGTSNQKNVKLSSDKKEANNKEDFKKPKTANALMQYSKDERMNQKLQKRKNKINDFINKKRGLVDIDSDVSVSQSYGTSNLTALADTSHYNIPPKIVALIALNDASNLNSLSKNLEEILKISIQKETNSDDKYGFHKINELMLTSSIPHQIFKGKERLTIITTKREIYSILDVCKVADILVFVSSCKNVDASNWKLDPDKYSPAIDEFGYKILSMIRAQGIPNHIGIIQDLDLINQKSKNEIKKLFTRYFESELQPDKVLSLQNTLEYDSISQVDEYKNFIRNICGMNILSNLELRKHRSFMLAEKVILTDKGLELSGYIKGNTLSIKNYIHISGFGDYQMESIEYDNDPIPIKSHQKISKGSIDVDMREKTNIIQDTKSFLNINNEKELYTENNVDNKPKVIDNKGDPSIMEKKLNDELDKNIAKLFDFKMVEDEDYDISFDENDQGDDDIIDENGNKISRKHLNKISVKYRTPDEMQFPDEVDTPIDMSARERFKKYRGLSSFKEGSWDPNENLPKEYSNLYHFQNFKQTTKKIIKTTHEEGLKISGTYIKIKVRDFKNEDIPFILNDTPLIVSTLLEHEKKVCVMHFKVTPHYEYYDKIMSKNLYEIHAGFRRFLSKPVFSFDQNCDKLKYEKSLIQDKFYLATIYGQLIYPNTPISFYRPNIMNNNQLELVAKGTVVEENSNKIILKKIILTGYPLKIQKKKAVVRYMFFNPEDVNYFKPIELSTKNGLRGHIKESLGTHGYMKCFFNDFIKSHDTVCMTLYKRVFPKVFRETWKYKIYYGNRNDYIKYFIDDNNLKREKEILIKKQINSIETNNKEEEKKAEMTLD